MMDIKKAQIVEPIESKYRVRIPFYHGVVGSANYISDRDLPLATTITQNTVVNQYMVGDIVYVIFENDDKRLPIIIGLLGKNTIERKSVEHTVLNRLEVKGQVELPENTSIGVVSDIQIGHLRNIRDNIQGQLDGKLGVYNLLGTYENGDLFTIEEEIKSVFIILIEGVYQIASCEYNTSIGTSFKVGDSTNHAIIENNAEVSIVGSPTAVMVYTRS